MNTVYSPVNFMNMNHGYSKKLTNKYLEKNKKQNEKRFGKNKKELLDLLTKEENIRKAKK